MASINEMINLHQYQYGRPQGGQSAAGTLADIMYKRSEENRLEQRAIQMQAAEEERQMQQAQRMMRLLNTADQNANRINTDLEKADRQPNNMDVNASVVDLPQYQKKVSFGFKDGKPVQEMMYSTPSEADRKSSMERQRLEFDLRRDKSVQQADQGFILGEVSQDDYIRSLINAGLSPKDVGDRYSASLQQKQRFGGGRQIPSVSGGGVPGGTQIPSGGNLGFGGQGGTQIPSVRTMTEKFDPVTGEPLDVTNIDAMAEREKIVARAKRDENIVGAQMNTINNLDLISGASYELARTYADAVREGGMGDIISSVKSKTARKIGNPMGLQIGSHFPASNAYPGQITELVSRIMPLLTQQGDQPGSVRLVESIFTRMVGSFPSENIDPVSGRRMIEQTLRNLYRFARASHRLGISQENGMVIDHNTGEVIDPMNVSFDKRQSLLNRVQNLASTIKLEGEEQEALDSLVSEVLSPIDELIQERYGRQRQPQEMPEESQGNLQSSYEEGATATNPQTGEKVILQNGQWVPLR